ncbi:Neurogenic Locus Notch-like Protein 2, partial [Manis pentadactyla]
KAEEEAGLRQPSPQLLLAVWSPPAFPPHCRHTCVAFMLAHHFVAVHSPALSSFTEHHLLLLLMTVWDK